MSANKSERLMEKLFLKATALLCLVFPATTQAETAKENPYEVPFFAPENFIKHGDFFKEEMIKIGDHPIYDYNTPGSGKPNSGFGNIIIFEGEDTLVVIDTSVSKDNAAAVLKDIRTRTDKPIEAIIYTHHHADHVNGAAAFVGDDNDIKIIATENLLEEVAAENQATGPIMGLRAAYMYGNLLPADGEGKYFHVGCCGFHAGGTNGFVEPNTFIPLDGSTEMTLAGEKFVFFATGGEAASHLAIYLPDRKVLFTGDELQGPTFPQLHSLRGTKPRDIIKWVNAIDEMRAYDIEHLVPSHGQPVNGAENVDFVLTNYRDSMQYVHDHAVRLINMGYSPDDIAEELNTLPETLQIEPWTTEYYGNVDVSARNVYGGYISWWNGDPATLRPTPKMERAKRLIKMMGGRDIVFAQAEASYLKDDPQWAAELTTLLIRVNKEDWDARFLKASSLKKLGYQETSSSTKGFYLTGALELEGKVNPGALQTEMMKVLFDVESAATALVFENMRYQINPARSEGVNITLGYNFTDTGEAFTLILRNGILEILDDLPAQADAIMTMERSFTNKILRGEETHMSGIANKNIALTGDNNKVKAFYAVMDTPSDKEAPFLVLR